ncbi:MAG: QueT transporter family protein [Dysosmobacter sp.]|uniref:QueT transporter family protein n=1 Tax=Dysosmobacter sp. TaxID=2591382 RepID=UPI00284B0FF0|nr:QueT transporter family protein [Dysosmobacter sp.]MDR3982205.1 QueT transporter family protein [Dysosmobacter sp.]
MSNSRFTTHQLATAGVIAALYAVLAYFASIFGIAYGPIQCRFSEALCVLPFLFPAATPGLFVGCLVANLLSPYGALDIIFGSLATLLAAVWTQHTHHKWLAPLPPVLCNAVIVGAVISFQETGFTGAFAGAFAYNAVTVGVGEAIACYVLGGVLLTVLPKVPALRRQMPSCS